MSLLLFNLKFSIINAQLCVNGILCGVLFKFQSILQLNEVNVSSYAPKCNITTISTYCQSLDGSFLDAKRLDSTFN